MGGVSGLGVDKAEAVGGWFVMHGLLIGLATLASWVHGWSQSGEPGDGGNLDRGRRFRRAMVDDVCP